MHIFGCNQSMVRNQNIEMSNPTLWNFGHPGRQFHRYDGDLNVGLKCRL